QGKDRQGNLRGEGAERQPSRARGDARGSVGEIHRRRRRGTRIGTGDAPLADTSSSSRRVVDQHRYRICADVGLAVGGGEIRLAVTVEVADRDRPGSFPVAKGIARWKFPCPSPSSTARLLAVAFAITRSSFPSPFRSATVSWPAL